MASDTAPSPAADDPHRITSLERIRAILGEPSPLTSQKIGPGLDEQALAFVRRSPFLLLSTADAEGQPDVTPRGDEPGFVATPDPRTLLVPERKGNRLVFALQNVLANPSVALIFLVPGTEETLRVHGVATLTDDPAVTSQLVARGAPALLALRIEVRRAFFHCAKAFRRSALWQPESWPPPGRISFGRIFAEKTGADEAAVRAIDQAIEDNYKTSL